MGVENVLKEHERDARDEEIAQLQVKVSEIIMDNELLYEKLSKLEGGQRAGSLMRRTRIGGIAASTPRIRPAPSSHRRPTPDRPAAGLH